MKKISIIIFIVGGFFFYKYGGKHESALIASDKIQIKTIENESSNNVLQTSSLYALQHKLKIDEHCIGCGRCIAVAPRNFKMNNKTYLAEVVSQDDINSQQVRRAIDICPTSSISI